MKLILENWREFVNKEPERLDEGVMSGLVIQKMMAKVDDLIQSNNLNEVDNIIPLLKNLIGSIASRVGPAVTNNLEPVKIFV